jgi:tetratricopeptide (TPR) repeat protein
MESFRTTIKCLVASGFISVWATLCSADRSDQIKLLYNELATSDAEKFAAIEREIKLLWSLSGSPGVDFLYRRGENSFQAKRFDVAAQHFSAVIEMAPKFASGWHGRARAYKQLGYFGPAIEDLQAALRLDAMHYLSLVLLGEIFEYFERPDLAFTAYSKVLTIHPFLEDVKSARDRVASATGEKTL